ncbi:MAG: CAP domain-containing protein [bacterium]|nr:CAP domain-containing protein [bacterium]
MKALLKKYFVPHKENDYKPHFFRERAVTGFAAFLLFIFGLTLVYSNVALGNYNFLAQVLPPALIGLANTDRVSNSLPELQVNPLLVLAAKYKADDMAAKSYFTHTSPEGLSPWFWFGKAGYAFSYAGENLAVDFSESTDVNTAWMNSAGHRANLLNKNFTEIGIATAKGFYQGRETTFVVQLFGTPLPVLTVPAVPTPAQSSAPVPTAVKPPPKPTAVPKVAGEEARVIAQNTGENNLYIEVKNAEVYKILSSPNESLAYLYMILGVLVGLALIVMVVVEIKYQHPRHIIYGLFLLALIGGLVYLNLNLLSNSVLII